MNIIKDDAHALMRMYYQNPEIREMSVKELKELCNDITWGDAEVVKIGVEDE